MDFPGGTPPASWALQPQFSAGGSPANLHISIHYVTIGHVSKLLFALRDSIVAVKDRSQGRQVVFAA